MTRTKRWENGVCGIVLGLAGIVTVVAGTKAEAATVFQITTSVTDIPNSLIGSDIAVGDLVTLTFNFDENAADIDPGNTSVGAYVMDSWTLDIGGVSISDTGGFIQIGDNFTTVDLVNFATVPPYTVVGDTNGFDPANVQLIFTGPNSFLPDDTLISFLANAATIEPFLRVNFGEAAGDTNNPFADLDFDGREFTIETTPNMVPTPEAATGGLALMGLVAVGGYFKRRNQAPLHDPD